MGGKKWSDEEIAVLSEHYGQCRTRAELLEKLPGRSYDAISMKAFFLGLKGDPRNSNRQYDLWFEAFCDVTSDAAYWAGFIAADGHITPNAQLRVHISQKDVQHLEALKTFLQYNGPLSYRQTTGYPGGHPRVELCIQSIDLCGSLGRVWNVPAGKKSDVLRLPYLEDEFLIDYIAGYFDGDGCMYHDKRGYLTITFVGNQGLLEEVRTVINRYFKIDTSKPYKNNQHSDAHMYRIHGKKAKQVLERFAQNNNSMRRKRL